MEGKKTFDVVEFFATPRVVVSNSGQRLELALAWPEYLDFGGNVHYFASDPLRRRASTPEEDKLQVMPLDEFLKLRRFSGAKFFACDDEELEVEIILMRGKQPC